MPNGGHGNAGYWASSDDESGPSGRRGCGSGLGSLIVIIVLVIAASLFYDDIRDFIGEFNLPSIPERVQVLTTDAPLPTPTILVLNPTSTVIPTVVLLPTQTPNPSPTAMATHTPLPILLPTTIPTVANTVTGYSIEVTGIKLLDNGLVDFLLEVKNDQTLEDEIAQLQMSVDGGAPELVNIIVNLLPGESTSFAFAREFAPGPHAIKFSIGDSHRTVSVDIKGGDVAVSTFTPQPTATPISTAVPPPMPTNTPVPTNTPLPTNTAVPINTATSIPTPETAVSSDQRHLEEKTYMLELINAERAKAGLNPVVLGDNIAAQLHAEAALENCFDSHWGVDGLKPYMRYSLAGGYQRNGENATGRNYCATDADGYYAISSVKSEILESMNLWMRSSGHRRSILNRWYTKVNIGLAWDTYNFWAYQHFEGDFVEYDQLPIIENGILILSGRTKNSARFAGDRDLSVQIYYDPPIHPLTRGQVARTYCYDSGLEIASLREPLTGNAYWPTNESTTSYWPCVDPYDVPENSPAPRSDREAHRLWEEAYDASQAIPERTITVPWITALEWNARGESFSVRADLSNLLAEHGDGVYTVVVWDEIGFEDVIISEYSIFYGITPPDTYAQ